MKKIILSLILVGVIITSFIRPAFSQEQLTYEEYLLPVTVDENTREPLKAMCEFTRQYDDPIYAQRKSWREYRNNDEIWELDKCNDKLKIVDFSIVPSKNACWHSKTYDLMKGDSTVVSEIYFFGFSSFFFNYTTNQFIILTSIKIPDGPPYREEIIITNNFVKKNPYYSHHLHFYENGILLLHDEYHKQSVVFMDIHNEKDTILYEYEIKSEHPDFVHKSLTLKDIDWIFECEENVFVNGVNLGKEKGHSKVFEYSYVDNKPFYFYEKDSLIYISYDDKTLPYKYKKVLHYLCCEPSSLNPRSRNDMIWFYAQKEDDKWYYVEMGKY